jgi:hypothetical protein
LVGEEIYYTFVVMKSLVWQFLNTKYEGAVIYRGIFDLSDKLLEKFVSDKGEVIIQFSRFHSGKETRTRVNIFLKAGIKRFFNIHEIDIEMYVLEWCRDKSIETIEM